MIESSFQSSEKEQLSQFRLSFEKIDSIEFISSVDLLNEKKLTIYLESVKEKIKAPNIMTAASLFSKRYSHLLIVPAFYAMSRYNKFLNIELENTEVMDHFESDLWFPKLLLKDQTTLSVRAESERNEWRRYFIQQLFSQHINQVWDVLSHVGKISKHTLWENTAVYTFWLYETVLQEPPCEKAIEDFNYLLFEADGSIFGNYSKNPLARFYSEKLTKNGYEIRLRKTCCLSCQIDEKYMCKSCPKTC